MTERTLQEIEHEIIAKINAGPLSPRMFDLGCGEVVPPEGFEGIDLYARGAHVTRRMDLFQTPWQIADGLVSMFTSSHFVEHVPDWNAHFAEIWRCLEPGGYYRFIGPYAKSDRYLQDPDHKQPLTEARLAYLQQAWLRENKIEHGRPPMNFSIVAVGYWWHHDYENEPESVRRDALLHAWNVANDIFVIIRKEELLPDAGVT